MLRLLRRAAVVGWAVVLAVAAVPAATCLAAADQQRMPCHGSTQHPDGSTIDQTCCPGESAAAPASSVAVVGPSIEAPPSPAAVLHLLIAPALPAFTQIASATGTFRSPGIPPFVLNSNFRI